MSTSKIERIKISEVTIDGRVQRGLDMRRAEALGDDFAWDAFGTPTISRRADRSLHAVDGQHRLMAATKAGHGERSVQMRVHEGLTLQQEAALFRKLNNTRRVLPVDLFRIAVVEGEEAAVEMNKMIEHVGLYVANSGERGFRAVSALREVYKFDPQAALRTLDMLTRAWGASANSVQAALVAGAGRFFIRYGEAPQVEKLVAKLAKYAGGPNALIGSARGLAKMRSVPVADGVADILVNLHNQFARQNQLAPWQVVR
jgi:hypothetical protein